MPAVFHNPNPFVGQTNRELRMLRHFVDAAEKGLKAAREADHAEIAAMLDQYGEDSEIMVLTAGGSHAEIHYEEIPRALRYSQVTSIFFTVEDRLVQLCDHIYDKKDGLPKKVGKIKGNSQFKACKTFLTEFIDAEVTVWDDLELARLVRNCIGHGNGFPDRLKSENDQKALRDGVEGEASLSLGSDDRLVITSDYVSRLLDAACTFFEQVFTNLDLGDESPLDFAGLPSRFGFMIDHEKKDWAVLPLDKPDLPGERGGSDSASPAD